MEDELFIKLNFSFPLFIIKKLRPTQIRDFKMLQLRNLTIETAVANHCVAMDAGDHFKNGASSKSLMSRRNFFTNKLNKRLFLVLLVAALTASYAQAQTKFGLRAGFNMTNFYQLNDKGDIMGLEYKPGYQIGVVADFPYLEGNSFQPGIIFATQGAKSEITYLRQKGKVEYNLNYIQIPMNFQYRKDLGKAKYLLQGGPYLGYGISGEIKVEVSDGKELISNSEKIKFGSGDDADFGAFDFGFGAGVGFQIGNLQTVIGGNYGLVKLNKDTKAKNIVIGLTLTYLFGK